MDRQKLLSESKTFCMLPWTHMHIVPEGDVLPCCGVDLSQPVGSLRKESLKDIWNGEDMRRIRRNMLSGKASKECERCYIAERAGSHTLRHKSNEDYRHHFDWVEQTNVNGSVPYFRMPYMDVRFSNVCNFRCRTCCPSLSSGTFSDHGKIFGPASHPKLLHPTDNIEDLWTQIEPLLPHIEEIYFAGGEPLLMDEHYRILDFFLEHGMQDVRIRYNTNFSLFQYRNWNVLDYWKQFKRVQIGASLDVMGSRGELLRKGQNWAKTVEMRKTLDRTCPHVDFYLAVTVSALNVFDLVDFHREWTKQGWIHPGGFVMSYLFTPEFMSTQVLTRSQKIELHRQLNQYCEDIRNQFGEKVTRLCANFQDVLNFTNAADHTELRPKLQDIMKKYDSLRDEESEQLFPYLFDNQDKFNKLAKFAQSESESRSPFV